MKNKLFIMVLLIIFLILFTLISCSKQMVNTTTTKVAEVTTTKAISTTQAVTTVYETTTTLNKDGELFLEAINDYDPIHKATEYAKVAYEIALEALENGLSDEEIGNKYMDLTIKVGQDFMVISVIKEAILEDKGIGNISEDMKKAIGLINDWSEKTKTRYEYIAKYYYGEGAEYDIKADELESEISDITDGYSKLRKQILLK